jgi:hypothetical protein
MTVMKSRVPGSASSPGQATSISRLIDYVESLGKDDSAGGKLLAESYVAELKNADKQQARWRRIYYEWRGFVIVASAAITALTAVNLHEGATFTFRVLTLALSALVTICTGLLELLQVNNRWRLYRQLRSKLERMGWQAALQTNESPAAPLLSLGTGLINAMHSFEIHYMSQVATDSNGGNEDPKAKGHAKPGTTGDGHDQPSDHNTPDQSS